MSQTPSNILWRISTSAAELAEIVAQRISQLPQRRREVLLLATYEGLNADEIASVLQMTTANVYSTLNIARSKLRRQLEAYLAKK